MITAVRTARVLVLLVLAVLAVSFVIGIGTPATGLLEKTVLLALIGGCVYAAAQVTTLSERVAQRFDRR